MVDRCRRTCAAVVSVVLLVAVVLSASVAAPARACGCGAYIPDRAGASIVDERALIAWDGAREDILMALRVAGGSDTAAWVMPVPSAARVSLGEAEVFTELERLTAPRIEYRDSWWPTFDWLGTREVPDGALAAAPPGGVSVLERQLIGPFDVARLAADDPGAASKWLTDNGFPHPDGLDANLAPYLSQGWQLVAVALTPARQGETLTGDLQPLRLSFAADRVVYPLRLSRNAATPQSVDLFVIAEHRMDPVSVPVADATPTLEYAGPVDGDEVSPALAEVVGDGTYLTRWSNHLADPAAIDGDYVFARAADDTAYQKVVYRDRNRGDVTGLALIGLLALGGVIVLWRSVSRRVTDSTART
jgi:hypothetical protein